MLGEHPQSPGRALLQRLRSPAGGDVVATGVTQLWRLAVGPLTLLFIPLFLGEKTQGLWYTFGSLSALSVFADLGFSSIVLQFSAPEFPGLSLEADGRVEGDPQRIERLGSLLRFVVKRTLAIAAIAFPVIVVAGFLVLARQVEEAWLWSWALCVFASGLNFVIGFLMSFIQGCDQVRHVQRVLLVSSVLSTVMMLVLLFFRAGLLALGGALLVSVAVSGVLIQSRYGPFLSRLWRAGAPPGQRWTSDILRLLWRYAISFASGYLIFQLYTPLTLRFQGAEAAGRVGISVSLWSGLFAIANVWLTSVAPKMNMLIARQRWADLDALFRRRLAASLATFAALGLAVFGSFALFRGHWPLFDRIASRFGSLASMAFLAVGWLFQVLINGMATYLRAHKQEPFVWLSLAEGLYLAVATFLCARYLPGDLLFLGFVSASVWLVPWAAAVFRGKRKAWHEA